RRPVALTIAGSDSGGGAGVEADLKTFEAHGVWGTAAITSVTAQNSLGVQTSEAVSAEVVRAQMASVAADFGVDAAKTGMLAAAIGHMGPPVVLITGGHLQGESSPDCLCVDGQIRWLEAARLRAVHTHGSGCVLSAAICAGLANGMDPGDACVAAKRFTERAIAAGFPLGSG